MTDRATILAGAGARGQYQAGYDAGPLHTTSFGVSGAAVTSADASTPVAVTDAPDTGEKLVILDIAYGSDAAVWLEFEEETSGTVLLKVFCGADSTGQFTPRGKMKLATANKRLMVDAEGAANIAVTCFYYSEA